MTITVNGDPRELAEGTTAAALVESLGLGTGWVVVEINRSVVPRAEIAEVVLNEGDVVEIVKAVAGG